MCSSTVDSEKYISRLTASVMVLMSGLAITAGSMPIFSAAIGSVLPTALAKVTTKMSVTLTVKATSTVTSAFPSSSRSTSSIFTKLTQASETPQSTATRISFHTTLRMSRGSVSPMDRLRMTAVELCEPELPPVP